MAADPLSAPLLVGFGADMLSMPFLSIPIIKRLLRMSFFQDMKELAERILTAPTAMEATSLAKYHYRERFPDLFH
jgi:phosphoenolpyruvate-protein kinase (PTS system EI component)